MKSLHTTSVKTNTRTRTAEATVTDRISSATLAVVGSTGLAIGLWSFAALVGGLVAGGGPLGLAGGYFSAVSGM